MSKATFSKAMDDHPKLKGKQSRLPDKIQAQIIGKKLKKTAGVDLALYEPEREGDDPAGILGSRAGQKRISIRMNKNPVAGAAFAGLLGSGVGALGAHLHKRDKLKAALGTGLGFAALREAERRIRNEYYGLDGTERIKNKKKKK